MKRDLITDLKLYLDLGSLTGIAKGSRGPHPIHGSGTGANFEVSADGELWRCYRKGHESGGNIFDFIGIKHGIIDCSDCQKNNHTARNDRFKEILQAACLEAGLDYESYQKKTNPILKKEEELVEEILAETLKYYKRSINQEIKNEIINRWGFSEEVISKFQMGFAPANDNLFPYLVHQGYTQDEVLNTGLFHKKDHRIFSVFKGRIMIPYLRFGKVKYFIGRQTPKTPDWDKAKYKKLPKYDAEKRPYVSSIINEPLFGLDSVGSDQQIIITEGISDAIWLMTLGFSVISPVTIRFKEDDLHRILRVVKNKTVIIVLDNEQPTYKTKERHKEAKGAGNEATEDHANFFTENSIHAIIAELPRHPELQKMDIASYFSGKPAHENDMDKQNHLHKHSKEDFEDLITKASIETHNAFRGLEHIAYALNMWKQKSLLVNGSYPENEDYVCRNLLIRLLQRKIYSDQDILNLLSQTIIGKPDDNNQYYWQQLPKQSYASYLLSAKKELNQTIKEQQERRIIETERRKKESLKKEEVILTKDDPPPCINAMLKHQKISRYHQPTFLRTTGNFLFWNMGKTWEESESTILKMELHTTPNLKTLTSLKERTETLPVDQQVHSCQKLHQIPIINQKFCNPKKCLWKTEDFPEERQKKIDFTEYYDKFFSIQFNELLKSYQERDTEYELVFPKELFGEHAVMVLTEKELDTPEVFLRRFRTLFRKIIEIPGPEDNWKNLLQYWFDNLNYPYAGETAGTKEAVKLDLISYVDNHDAVSYSFDKIQDLSLIERQRNIVVLSDENTVYVPAKIIKDFLEMEYKDVNSKKLFLIIKNIITGRTERKRSVRYWLLKASEFQILLDRKKQNEDPNNADEYDESELVTTQDEFSKFDSNTNEDQKSINETQSSQTPDKVEEYQQQIVVKKEPNKGKG